MRSRFIIASAAIVFGNFLAMAQPETIYEEAKVPTYELPDALISESGKRITSSQSWEDIRRPEILSLFERHVYGCIPQSLKYQMEIVLLEENRAALNGQAIRRQYLLRLFNSEHEVKAGLLLFIPNRVDNPPTFVGYNFVGNHTIDSDPEIFITESWVANREEFGIVNHQASEAARGIRSNRWPVATIIGSGFALATMYYGDIDPDFPDFNNGIHPLAYSANQLAPKKDEWGSIAAWAWGMSRIVDVLEQDKSLMNSPYIAFGHSRLGKTSLWAGACDDRFDIVISNNSGCGGAAISRRKFGETVGVINDRFPHWFNDRFPEYNENESALPVDQHLLLALIAPRPVYVASAEEDRWADPKGEFLSLFHASPVYQLYQKQGLPATMPALNQPIHHDVGYHIRTGKHDVTDYDWEQYIVFAKKHLVRQ